MMCSVLALVASMESRWLGERPRGWFGWSKSRLVSADSIVFCERK
jgi:hypothetical protein